MELIFHDNSCPLINNNNFVTAVSAGAKDKDRQLFQLLKEEEAHISEKIVALREEVGKRC